MGGEKIYIFFELFQGQSLASNCCRKKDRRTKKQKDIWAKRQKDRETERHRDRETERQRDRETERKKKNDSKRIFNLKKKRKLKKN